MDEDAHAPDTGTGAVIDPEPNTPVRPPLPPYPPNFGILSKKSGSYVGDE